ncbi:MAG TPA: polyketide synthase dehydratase domain-containing protein, partial [Thermoanaerobaculia bacterium]
MIDFIEYVVAELKSKRLSKTDAVALVRQYSRQSAGPATASRIHPLLHRNTSDLVEQRYSSTLGGDEPFLVDHQVAGEKVLPGVAYLEMARAAIEQALPVRAGASVLELHNTVWAQPVVVRDSREVSIALAATGDEQVDFEVYSQDGDRDVVHCQGHALVTTQAPPAALDRGQLAGAMGEGRIDPDALYATCARMGLVYGPSFRAITALHKGTDQVLAELRLPATDDAGAFVLQPALMDGALQAAVGLLDSEATEARLPFALETLRIVAPCTSSMFAWLRYAPGSRATDKVVKLDIDLCDDRGNVCVQMRGFSWRVLSRDLTATAAKSTTAGHLLAVPVWQPVDVTTVPSQEIAEQHVLSYLSADAGKSVAERFTVCALESFARIQSILQSKPKGKVLVQIVVADHMDQSLLAGLSGLLKTAALENPLFLGQLILVPAGVEDV